jgi:hypothetical protein
MYPALDLHDRVRYCLRQAKANGIRITCIKLGAAEAWRVRQDLYYSQGNPDYKTMLGVAVKIGGPDRWSPPR